MLRRHRHRLGLHRDRLGVHRRADRVAELEDVAIRALRAAVRQDAVVARRDDAEKARDPTRRDVLSRGGPERDAMVVSPGPVVRVHERAGEVAPLVGGAHVGEVDEVVHGERDAEAASLPREGGDALARLLRRRDAERAQVLPHRGVELHRGELAGRAFRGAGRHHPRKSEDGAVWVPLALREAHLGLDQHRLAISEGARELDYAILERDREGRRIDVRVPLAAAVPINSRDVAPLAAALYPKFLEVGLEVAEVVVDLNVGFHRDKQDVPLVRRPRDEGEVHLELTPPLPRPLDAADDDRAILVNDADLLPAFVPLHVGHDAAVAVVNHLFVPRRLVEAPHDDQPVRVGRCEATVRRVPHDAPHDAFMPIEGLVHREV